MWKAVYLRRSDWEVLQARKRWVSWERDPWVSVSKKATVQAHSLSLACCFLALCFLVPRVGLWYPYQKPKAVGPPNGVPETLEPRPKAPSCFHKLITLSVLL